MDLDIQIRTRYAQAVKSKPGVCIVSDTFFETTVGQLVVERPFPVAARHGQHRPELVEIHKIFIRLKRELETHMMKEERVLFPLCRQLDCADRLPQAHCGSIANPINVRIREHDDAGDALARIRELSSDYTPRLTRVTPIAPR
jgi:iron-sulfur cluster repair protein YtfE (RIC family)